MQKARTKSNISFKTAIIEDYSKYKNIGKTTKNLYEMNNQNKFSKEIY